MGRGYRKTPFEANSACHPQGGPEQGFLAWWSRCPQKLVIKQVEVRVKLPPRGGLRP